MAKKTIRGSVLKDGVTLTEGSRNSSYGPPEINLQCQMELWEVYRKYSSEFSEHNLSHEAAIQHVCAKLARIAVGSELHRDNYVDGATYFSIAFECDTTEELDLG